MEPIIAPIPIGTVIGNTSALNAYIDNLSTYIKNKSVREILEYARSICSGLPIIEEIIIQLNTGKKEKDKGLFGKSIEYGLFGQKPNSDSTPDLVQLGYDIKTCAFKHTKKAGKNAKERQTLTNCGNTNDYESFKNICDNERFSDCRYYKKSSKFILFVRSDDKNKWLSFDQLLDQRMLTIVRFDIDQLPAEMTDVINRDYAKIRQCIIDKKVSQTGQEFLHIHPHGAGHGSGNRALGFTSKFMTRIVALNLAKMYEKNIDEILLINGRSILIKKEYL